MERVRKESTLACPDFVFSDDQTQTEGITSAEGSFNFVIVLGVLKHGFLIKSIDDDDLHDEAVEDHDSFNFRASALDILKSIQGISVVAE